MSGAVIDKLDVSLPPNRIYLAELGCKADEELSHCNLIVRASQEFEEQVAISAKGQEQLHSTESFLEPSRIILALMCQLLF